MPTRHLPTTPSGATPVTESLFMAMMRWRRYRRGREAPIAVLHGRQLPLREERESARSVPGARRRGQSRS